MGFKSRGKLVSVHYPIIFKLFHHLFGLMNRCIVSHENQAGLQIPSKLIILGLIS